MKPGGTPPQIKIIEESNSYYIGDNKFSGN